jgi:tetratricopeptide (TPR) repeat protein
MRVVWTVLATVVLSLGLVPSTLVLAQSRNDRDANYAVLATKCVRILTCSTEDLEAVVRESDALRQEACGGTTCSDGNLKLMTQTEKEYLAKGNRARFELASRNAPKQSTETPMTPAPMVTQQEWDWCIGGSATVDQRIAGCTAAIRSGKELGASYYDRGNAYSDKGLKNQAIADYNKSIEIAPNFPLAYYNRGIVYAESGLYDQAIADFSKAISKKPDMALAIYNRGFCYAKKGMNDLAISDLRTTLQLDPNNKDAALYLAKLTGSEQDAARYLAIRNGYAQTASTSATGSNLNGEWLGERSGNRVTLEVQPGGLFFTAVTQNAAQATTGYLFGESGRGVYKYQFPDGTYAVIQLLGPAQLRVTNPDGWTDVFHRAGSSASVQRASPAQTPPAYSAAPSGDVPLCVAAGTC